jgi:phage gp36-like protein
MRAKCIPLDNKIARYRLMALRITDQQTLERDRILDKTVAKGGLLMSVSVPDN